MNVLKQKVNVIDSIKSTYCRPSVCGVGTCKTLEQKPEKV